MRRMYYAVLKYPKYQKLFDEYLMNNMSKPSVKTTFMSEVSFQFLRMVLSRVIEPFANLVEAMDFRIKKVPTDITHKILHKNCRESLKPYVSPHLD